MNYNKIGEYIANKRKEKNLTQQELADEIHVSVKAISKWECGKGIPEISNLQTLAKELDVSIIDILNGKDSKQEEVVVEYVKEGNKKSKIKVLFLSCLIVLLVILFALGLYFINNYNKIYAYRLSGESEHFSYDSGFVLTSNYANIISTGNLKILNKEFGEKMELLSIDIMHNDKIVIGSNELLRRTFLNIENNGYNDLLKENVNKDSKWIVKINYAYEKEIRQEEIELKQELVFKNNKVINVKEEPVSDEKIEEEITATDLSYGIPLRDYLINEKDFIEAEDTVGYVYKIENGNTNYKKRNTIVFPFVGRYSSTYLMDKYAIHMHNYIIDFPYKRLRPGSAIFIVGEYVDSNDNNKMINAMSLDETEFGITYNYEKDTAVCNYKKCPDNIYEISKIVYSDYLEVREKIEELLAE